MSSISAPFRAPPLRLRVLLAMLALLAALAAPMLRPIGPDAAASKPPAAAVTATAPTSLEILADAHPDRRVEVIVQLRRGVARHVARALVARRGGVVVRDLHLINGLGVRITAARALDLRADPRVRAVSLNGDAGYGARVPRR